MDSSVKRIIQRLQISFSIKGGKKKGGFFLGGGGGQFFWFQKKKKAGHSLQRTAYLNVLRKNGSGIHLSGQLHQVAGPDRVIRTSLSFC